MPHQAWAETLRERLSFLQDAEVGLSGADQLLWLKRMDDEQSALQKLARQAVAAGQLEDALSITNTLALYWLKRGKLTAGQRGLTWLLAIPACERWPILRSKALLRLGEILEQQADYWAAEQCLQSALQLAEAHEQLAVAAQALTLLSLISFRRGQFAQAQMQSQQALQQAELAQDTASQALALRRLGLSYSASGRATEAGQCYQESLRLFEALGDVAGQAHTLNNFGSLLMTAGKLPEAQNLYERALALFRPLENPLAIAMTLGSLGRLAWFSKQPTVARDYANEAVLMAREIGVRELLVLETACLGLALIDCGEEGYALFRESLAEAREADKLTHSPVALYGIAEMFARHGQPHAAVQMLSLLLNQPSLSKMMRPSAERLLEQQRVVLPASDFDAALTRGQHFSLTNVIEHILKQSAYELPTFPA
ncbi:MAG: tetratricopeptide repeat protein [Anaerolineales bacterium]|nr:tetratricopeptide repeat protein [Anaerolineales bacterium]